MSILSAIVNALFGGGGSSGPSYGPFDPSDFARFHQAFDEISSAEDDAAQVRQVYAKYGIKNEGMWGSICQAFHQANAGNPDFHVVAINQRVREQLANMGEHYAFPMEYLEPVEGVAMDRLAAIVARREAAGSPAAATQVLAQYGLDEPRFQRINAAWTARMGGNADAMAANIVGGFWHTYLAVARSAVKKAA
jgi:hypothetical protein